MTRTTLNININDPKDGQTGEDLRIAIEALLTDAGIKSKTASITLNVNNNIDTSKVFGVAPPVPGQMA